MACGYCNASNEDLKQCQLRASRYDKWQSPKWICKSCRKYLRGLFRYYPDSETLEKWANEAEGTK
ncbi:hypothetical protein M0R04_08390 [Candidatus Dojkabacteria bacterium]|jgi:hypothetical protein|nr:hypothetical protein [Candidatus Dojkabacteria bacterium]